tara:strand:+ start:163 stop:1002 length:840 start_codon:yes stop_codon:yes gene_type:complete
MVPLEDSTIDIVKKASIGKGYGERELAKQCQCSLHAIQTFFKGNYSKELLKSLAHVLNLDYQALRMHALGHSQPPEIELNNLKAFLSKFPYSPQLTLSVNHYLVSDPVQKTAFLFDTGTSASECLTYLEQENLSLEAICITHQHKDHTYALDDYRSAFPKATIYAARLLPEIAESKVIKPDTSYSFGCFTLSALATPGHTKDGLSFAISGLELPLILVGDALFAHSQGGTNSQEAYCSALQSNREQVLSQGGECVLAPGHGPLTTVAHELKYNPFYANN